MWEARGECKSFLSQYSRGRGPGWEYSPLPGAGGGDSVHQGLLRPLLEEREPGWMLGEGGKFTGSRDWGPHSSSSLRHLASAHRSRTDSVPLARLSPGSQTLSSPGDWGSEFSVGDGRVGYGETSSPRYTHSGP